MKLNDWLEKWGLTSLRINAGFLDMNFAPKDPDRAAAWELYIELLTRVATQHLAPEDGDEKTALESIHNLFALTRDSLKKHPRCTEFAKLAVVVLNQIVRPFTAKWHRLAIANAFAEPARREEFRAELASLQEELRKYTMMLSGLAAVEDLTDFEVRK